MKFVFIAFIIAVKAILQSKGKTPSLLNPPWKHCVHRLQAKKTWQGIVSPGFPKGITTQTQCSWIITVLPPRRIKLSFKTLNLTGSANNCFTQSVEYWEIRTASSMGKFCGGRRPGDYVSYGSQVRVDLKADTAAAGHAGFELQYRFTREPGGFKKSNSFWSKKKTSKSKAGGKTKLKTVGGRVNLGIRKKLRNQLKKKPKPPTSLKPKPPRFSVQPTRQTRRYFRTTTTTSSYQKKRMITLRDDSNNGIQLWIIVLIAVGGFLFLLIVAVISWLCFCRKNKRKQVSKQNNNPHLPRNPSYLLTQQADFPGARTGFHPHQDAPSDETGFDGHPHKKHTPARRAPKEESKISFIDVGKTNTTAQIQANDKPNYENQENLDVKQLKSSSSSLSKKERKLLKHLSSNLSDDCLSTDDEGYETSKAKNSKDVPTMKRELSQWEKNELNRIKRKM